MIVSSVALRDIQNSNTIAWWYGNIGRPSGIEMIGITRPQKLKMEFKKGTHNA